MLEGYLNRAWRKVRRTLAPRPESLFPLRRPLPLPEGTTEAELRRLLLGVRPVGAPEAEMANYVEEDFERFVLTWSLAQPHTGACLELGANPYFTTTLLRRFTPLRLTLANWFGPQVREPMIEQRVLFPGESGPLTLATHHFDIEKQPFPFADGTFDVVLCCEILEHLAEDPWHALREARRVLRPGGVFILTTPNVARLENVARLLAGANIYDPYSGYGPHGRHNREYTLAELCRFLTHVGFSVETAFTADVRENRANLYALPAQYLPLLQRRDDLGQYLFVRAQRNECAGERRPAWLFRSYPPDEVESSPESPRPG